MAGRVPWVRVLGEGAVIVVSILLAFALDAFWTARGERELAATYVDDIFADLESDSAGVARWSGLMDDKVVAIEGLLADLNGTGPKLSPVEALTSLNTAALVPTLPISDATYRDLVGSGNLRILSPEARRTIVRYYTAALTVDRALALYERQGKPPFTGLIPGRMRGMAPDCSGDLTICYVPAELATIDAWRSRQTIRDELQLERGNAKLAQSNLRTLADAIAATQLALAK